MLRGKQFHIEHLERRLLLSSTIAAFGAQQTFAAGNHPRTVATADINGDGKLDLVVANFGSSSVSVMLGNGNGTFQTQTTFAAGIEPYAVAVADVNGDGKSDLLAANYKSASVSVVLGNGDGTFEPQQTFAAGSGAHSVAVADLNGDGKPDLVVTDYGRYDSPASMVSVLLGNGDGFFQSPRTFATLLGPVFVAVADVNRDGKPDLIVADKLADTVSVLLGHGDGTFAPQQSEGAFFSPTHLALADLNGDGKLDLVGSSFTNPQIGVLSGNGDGTFGAEQTFATAAEPSSLTVADVNGDGKPDIVTADLDSNKAGVLLGNGDMTFQAEKTFAVGSQLTSVAVADVNGDGRQDIITTNYLEGTVSVLLGDVPPTVLSINRTSPPGPITSDPSVTYTVTFNESVTGVDPTDFSLTTTGSVTASSSVVVTPVSGSVYTVAINGISGTGTLGLSLVDDGSIRDPAGNPLQSGSASFQSQSTFATGAQPRSVAVSDMNGDGSPDLVITSDGSSTVGVMLGNGNGTFQAQRTFTTGSNPRGVAVSDVNGDGRADLVVVNSGGNTVSVLLGNGNGTFQAQQTFATGSGPIDIAVSDVNGDGRPDLVVSNYNSNTVSVLLGNGNGTFQAQQTFVTGHYPSSVAVSDVNGDGKPDVVVANWHGNTASVLLGNGNGTFQSQQTVATGSRPFSVAVSDVNGDGKPDLVCGNNVDGTLGVLLGNGNGTFQAQQTFAAGTHLTSVAVADLNQDGKPDLVVNNFNNSGTGAEPTVSVLLGNGNGTFQSRQTLAAGSGPWSVSVADLNGDGSPDVVVANLYSGTVSVLIGNSNPYFTGQTYTIVPSLDTITGSFGVDQITLVQNPDNQHIDWTINGTTAEMAISDPNGLTTNGNGSNDVITLQYTNGNPLPNTVHLNGVFTINGLQGTNPLLNTTLEVGRSTVYISYASAASDPIGAIKRYLQNGYNNGGWNGIPAASPAYPGAITSMPAAQNAMQTTAIGYADSADGLISGPPTNTIELTYTLYGDTGLIGSVSFNDFTRLTQHYNQTTGGTWDTGDFNYDGSVNFGDFTLMTRTYNTSLASQAMPNVSPAFSSPATLSSTTPVISTAANAGTQTPAVQTKPAASATHHLKPLPKHPKGAAGRQSWGYARITADSQACPKKRF